MAMTVTERQRKFRAERRKKGLVKKDVWTDRTGLLAPLPKVGDWPKMSIKDLEKELKKMFGDLNDKQRNMLNAELLEYAKTVKKQLKHVFDLEKSQNQDSV